MKYKKLTLSFIYEKYNEWETNHMNGYLKNKVYYSLGEFHIFVDIDKVEDGRNKLIKSANKKLENTLKSIK